MTLSRLLENLRDRVIRRSQLGKQRLDTAFTQRELDRWWAELGERYSELARQDQVVVPKDLTKLIEEIRRLEKRLEEQRRAAESLRGEVSRET